MLYCQRLPLLLSLLLLQKQGSTPASTQAAQGQAWQQQQQRQGACMAAQLLLSA
jgi:hypothetical protein